MTVNQALEISASKATEDKNKIFESGNGTQDDPYIIHTTDQLQKFAKSVTADNDYSGKYIVLDSDVNISDISWEQLVEMTVHLMETLMDKIIQLSV